MLQAGMTLVNRDNEQTLKVVSQTKLDKTDTVYNFEVDEFHTYHIGEFGVWVHNADCLYNIDNVSERILNAQRIRSGLKDDIGHRAASFLTNSQLKAGKVFKIVGNDGVERALLQTKGKLDGHDGIFEYIIDSSNNVTHQRFIRGGVINGVPNQRVIR